MPKELASVPIQQSFFRSQKKNINPVIKDTHMCAYNSAIHEIAFKRLKVSYSQKGILVSSNIPKNEPNV